MILIRIAQTCCSIVAVIFSGVMLVPGAAAAEAGNSTAPAQGISGAVSRANVQIQNLAATGQLNDTGIIASQCHQAGSIGLVACSSAGAIALSNAQDGMIGRDVNTATNSNTDGKLGFSFSAIPGGCVLDNVTGLMWEVKTADGGLRDWNKTYTNYTATYDPYHLYGKSTDASGFVAAVNAAKLCGYSDWRLPNVEELQSIVDYSVAAPGPTVDTAWFPNTQGNTYWSASFRVGHSNYAWVVWFYSGNVHGSYGRDGTDCVRLVRGGQPLISARYTLSADGQEVTDNQTRLIWRRCAEGMVWNGATCAGAASAYTYEAALQHASVQANSTGIAWRLPNVKELASIADRSRKDPAIEPMAFPATPGIWYWTSTPDVGGSNGAWIVGFNYSFVDNIIIPEEGDRYSGHVRLVRAGQ